MRIAVIPARGGSKRIPRKNIRDFLGKPIIARPVRVAKESGLFAHVIVSTDDTEIAEVARRNGAEVPFMRPAELSGDYVATADVIAHAARFAISQGWQVDAICCIYATAAFVEPRDIQAGFEALQSGPWAYVFSATHFRAPIFRSFKQRAEGGIEMFFPHFFKTRSQDLPIALHDAGQFYWGTTSAWLEQKQVFAAHSTVVLLPTWKVQDIDTEDDWQHAELLAGALQLGDHRTE